MHMCYIIYINQKDEKGGVMKALDVAARVINRCIEIDKPVSNLKLQKVLYFLDLWHLIHTKERLITDEDFQAWQYGPVLPSVYKKYALYAGNPIDSKIKGDIPEFTLENEKLQNHLYGYLDLLADVDPWELVRVSHKEDQPWYKTYHSDGDKSTISNDLLEEYAKTKRNNNVRN